MISITEIMKGKPVDYFPDALHKLHDGILSRVTESSIELSTIMFHVSLQTGVPEKYIKGKVRKREYVYARQLYSYLAKFTTKFSLEIIGDFVRDGYDHATVLYGKRNIENLMFSDKKVKNDVDTLMKILKNGRNIQISNN